MITVLLCHLMYKHFCKSSIYMNEVIKTFALATLALGPARSAGLIRSLCLLVRFLSVPI